MTHPYKAIWKSLVRQFYIQNAGFFFFIFMVFFGVVAPSEQPAYHYALIRGIIATPAMLALVMTAWLWYTIKCCRWIIGLLQSPDHRFLHMLVLKSRSPLFKLLLRIHAALYLPVLGYALAIVGVALYQKNWPIFIIILAFNTTLCLISTTLYLRHLLHPGLPSKLSLPLHISQPSISYWSILARNILTNQKALWIGIKLYGCLILYLLLKLDPPAHYDIRMPFLAYTIGLFGHGLLIHQLREMESQRLRFYRGMPISLLHRWLQYGILFFLVMTPEMITIAWLSPHYMQYKDALGFVLAGYSTLLLLNSCLFIASLKKSDLLKLVFVLFGILYFGVLSDHLILLSGLLLAVAGGLFFRGYCRWEG